MSSTIYDLTKIFKHGTNTHNAHVNDGMTVIDKDWIMSRFMTPNKNLTNTVNSSGTGYRNERIDAVNRFSTSANFKFTDTSMGGNVAVNARPQFTRYCDIPARSKVRGRPKLTIGPAVKTHNVMSGYGMGRYYSEAIDDNQQHIYLEFGVPKFSGLIDFFTRSIDYEESMLANTGSTPLSYTIGKAVGGLAMMAAFPLITSIIWLTQLGYKALTSIGQDPFAYYYINPTPHMYWGTVSSIVVSLATEMGILSPMFMKGGADAHMIGLPINLNQTDIDNLASVLPGLIHNGIENDDPRTATASNYIDVFAMASKVQNIADLQMKAEYELSEQGITSNKDYLGYVLTSGTEQEDSTSAGVGLMKSINYHTSFYNFIESIKKTDLFKADIKEDKDKPAAAETPPASITTTTTTTPAPAEKSLAKVEFKKDKDGKYPVDLAKDESWLTKYAQAQDAAVRDGGRYAIFAVDYVGTVSESFSSSTGEIAAGQMLKQVGGSIRDVKFNLGGGNITDGVKTVVDAASGLIAGALDSVTFGASSVLAAITGGGFIDLPKKWEDSEISLPTITYSMQLISPYGNVFSQLQNIYIPLAMIMAGALPLATGKASYTSPYLCRLYNKGVQKINMGMITSLSITRGTSNLGWNKYKRPLAIDVTFTVTDFSTIMGAPISDSLTSNAGPSIESVTPLSNYLATLASRDINTDKYFANRAKMKASKILMDIDRAVSPAQWGMMMGEKMNFILGGLASDHAISISDLNQKAG